jgi:hypothetical protein
LTWEEEEEEEEDKEDTALCKNATLCVNNLIWSSSRMAALHEWGREGQIKSSLKILENIF